MVAQIKGKLNFLAVQEPEEKMPQGSVKDCILQGLSEHVLIWIPVLGLVTGQEKFLQRIMRESKLNLTVLPALCAQYWCLP